MAMEYTLQKLEQDWSKAHFEQLIGGLRNMVGADRRVLSQPIVKQWLGLRWRNLFLQAARHDRRALRVAKGWKVLNGKRLSPLQILAQRFLKDAQPADWDLALPVASNLETLHGATLIFCPGFINGLLPVHAFEEAFAPVAEALGCRFLCADAHPFRGCEANVPDLLAAVSQGRGFMPSAGCGANIEMVDGPPPGPVILMGYSKGSPDILALLARHPELKNQVRAVYTWAGAVGGSFTANNIAKLVESLPVDALPQRLHGILSLLMPGVLAAGPMRRLDEYAVKEAIKSLTTFEREAFVSAHGGALDDLDIPFFCITGSTSLLEVPTFQMADYMSLAKADPDNDMQVTQAQAKLNVPMASHLATLHGHHWDIAYPPFPRRMRMTTPNLDHPFPRAAALTANLQLVAELGLI
ncbi:MAG: hypothetical protein U0998_05650 [Moraxellaceae bacterium]|nr:hypothetical protein [Moraxellaceae bacterium]MDZ4386692.1 hypothetical protein [Moraxellaceae bacterium]